jgi:hypothetical protein
MRYGQVKPQIDGLLIWLGGIMFALGLGVLFSGLRLFGPAPVPLAGVLDSPLIGCTAGPALMILGGIIMKLPIRS